MDIKILSRILIAISIYYAADSVCYGVLGKPILELFGTSEGFKSGMVVHFVFNLAFAAFVWQISRRPNS